ncbi:MAG: fluoride efflux transporter CrcB [Lachnospiraceae bacterium]|nr:fluoride efflux transporter CrcB [Lachnospiraceae bacterium]
MNFLFVGLGGAVGAIGRYAISLIPVKSEFPVLTLMTNVLGAVLIGFVVGVASSRDDISQNTVLFLKTGVCGGFTTFSTFSLEAYNLLEEKHYFLGGSYMALSVLCCVVGVIFGKKLAQYVVG